MLSRVLLDTNIVRSGFVSSAGASRLLLQSVLTGRATAVASTALMLEYEDVLLRPDTLQRAGVTAQDALTFLDGLCAFCLPVTVWVRWRPQSPDSSDDMVIDAAVNGLADTLATFNLRELSLAHKPLTVGTARVLDGYNILNQEYFAASLENDAAQDRIAQSLADQITLKLGIYFKQAAAPA